MGYTRILQYGQYTELFEYEREIHRDVGVKIKKPQGYISPVASRRLAQRRRRERLERSYSRSQYSISRARDNFFRLVHHNNMAANTIHFVTITYAKEVTYPEVQRNVAAGVERLKKQVRDPLSWIYVPERQKNGRLHIHMLLYNLPAIVSARERDTRNIQRCFRLGYVDVRFATYTTAGLAGYMAKYMAKALASEQNEVRRAYNCSRNIDKVRVSSGNALFGYLDLIVTGHIVKFSTYDVPFLGECAKTVYTDDASVISGDVIE